MALTVGEKRVLLNFGYVVPDHEISEAAENLLREIIQRMNTRPSHIPTTIQQERIMRKKVMFTIKQDCRISSFEEHYLIRKGWDARLFEFF